VATELVATLPYRWYTDPDVARREQERIFARTWQYWATSTTSSARTSTTAGSPTCSRSTTRSSARTRRLVESVHRGMRSGLVEHGRLLLESEQLILAFQRWLVDAVS
jgi:phenylpropionate dioxygenase-like ring-hydroxylating dioxygenase large terminal subunit